MTREQRVRWAAVLNAAKDAVEIGLSIAVDPALLIAVGKALDESERPRTTEMLTEAARQGFYGTGADSSKG